MNEKAANSLADPEKYENLFPDLPNGIEIEEILKPRLGSLSPASEYPKVKVVS